MPFDEAIAVPGLIRRDVARLRQDPQLAELRVTTGLDTLFVLVGQRIDDLRVPILLVVFQVGAFALAILAGWDRSCSPASPSSSPCSGAAASPGASSSPGQGDQRRTVGGRRVPARTAPRRGTRERRRALERRLALTVALSDPPETPMPSRSRSSVPVLGVVTLILLVDAARAPHDPRGAQTRVAGGPAAPSRAADRGLHPPLAAFAFIQLRTTGTPSIEQAPLEPLVLLTPTLLVFGLSFLALRLLLFALAALRSADRTDEASLRVPGPRAA